MKTLSTKIVCLILMLVFITGNITAQQKDVSLDPRFETELIKTMNSAFTKSKAIGASAALLMPNGKMWRGVSGISSVDLPISENMLFDIGSSSKNYLAVLVLKLVEEGLVSLDDRISKWLPAYPNVNPNITIRQLLNQTDGIDGFVEDSNSPWRIGFKNIDHNKKWTPEEVISTFVGKPLFEPGKGWAYSQTNYILLRMIIEKATNSKAYSELEKRLLKPLGLNYTTAYMLNKITDSLVFAHPWLDDDNDGNAEDISQFSLNWMATFVPMLTFSSATDLATWMHSLLHEKKILSKQMLDQMLTFHKTASAEPMTKGYGLGLVDFNIGFVNPKWAKVTAWGHSGNQYGYMTFAFYFPEYKFTLVLMMNRGCDGASNEAFSIVLNSLLDTVLRKFGAKESDFKNFLDVKLDELKNNPTDLDLSFMVAKMLQKNKEEEKAFRLFENIVRLDPSGKSNNYLESLFWKSMYDGMINKKPESINNFIEEHSNTKYTIQAYKYLLKTYLMIGEKENALLAAQKAFNFFEQNPDLVNDYGWFIYEIKVPDLYNLAISSVLKATQKKPQDYNIWDTLAWLYFANGEKQKAIEAEEQAYKLDPQNNDFQKNLGLFKSK